MSKPSQPTPPDRRARLAEELRRNLKRRKAQDRARTAAAHSPSPAADDKAASPGPESAPLRTGDPKLDP